MARRDYYHDPDAPRANSIVPAVTVVVVTDGRILLEHRVDNDLWALPGGALEPGETASDAAVRKTFEETGIRVEIVGVVGIYSDPGHVIEYDDGEVRQQFSICLRADPVGGELEARGRRLSGLRGYRLRNSTSCRSTRRSGSGLTTGSRGARDALHTLGSLRWLCTIPDRRHLRC